MHDARPWTHAALFGALWGAVELSLGTVLHLGRLPLKGLLLGAVGVLCLVTLRRLQPRAGVCLLAGVVAAFLKVFTLGGLFPGPILGILGEAVLVEAAFLATLSRWPGAVLGGALALGVVPLQLVAMTWLTAGGDALAALADTATRAALLLGLPAETATTALTLVVAASAAAGAAVGALSWRLAGRVKRRRAGAS